MKKRLQVAPAAVLGITLLFGQLLAAEQPKRPELGEQVRHELVMLPFYSVFDNFEYAVDGDVVTLTGQVSHPRLKADAEAVVKRMERVSQVINNIEVLPRRIRNCQTRNKRGA